MNATTTGLLAGLILGVAGSIGGFGPFLITLVPGFRSCQPLKVPE